MDDVQGLTYKCSKSMAVLIQICLYKNVCMAHHLVCVPLRWRPLKTEVYLRKKEKQESVQHRRLNYFV